MAIITGIIADSAGNPASGRIEFRQLRRFDNGTVQVTGTPVVAQVQAGQLRTMAGGEFSLPPSPAGTAVLIQEILGGRTYEWTARVPEADAVEYRALEPVEPEGVVSYAPPPWLAEVLAARDQTVAAIEDAHELVDTLGGLAGIQAEVTRAQTAAAQSTAEADRAKGYADALNVNTINTRLTNAETRLTGHDTALGAKADLVSGVVPDAQLNARTTATAGSIPKRGTNGVLPGIGAPVAQADAATKKYVDDQVAPLIAKRVERRSLTSALSGTAANAQGIYYQDLAPVVYTTPFTTLPLLVVSAVSEWGWVQWVQVYEESLTGFKCRALRVATAPAAPKITYTAVEA